MSLKSLPPELILAICDYLSLDGILALKMTDVSFNNALPLTPRARNTTLSDCARLAIRTYLASPHPAPSHMRCILCKAVYPLSLFDPNSCPTGNRLTQNAEQSKIVALPGRICAWHVGRLANIVYTGSYGRNEWISQMDRMCMHCGAIQGVNKCGCNCDSCSFRTVRTFTRFLSNDRECQSFVFWQPAANDESTEKFGETSRRLWVRETCRGNYYPFSPLHMPCKAYAKSELYTQQVPDPQVKETHLNRNIYSICPSTSKRTSILKQAASYRS